MKQLSPEHLIAVKSALEILKESSTRVSTQHAESVDSAALATRIEIIRTCQDIAWEFGHEVDAYDETIIAVLENIQHPDDPVQ